MSQDYDDEDYYLPLEDQRVFGAGIRRKRVPFVRSGELNTTTTPGSSSITGTNIADAYLSIVLKQNNTSNTSPSTPTNTNPSDEPIPPPRTTHSAPPSTETKSPAPPDIIEFRPKDPEQGLCEVCSLPLSDPQQSQTTPAFTRPHEASLAHQVCLKHSHPPSHLDRTRAGMRYLSTYGWDPDSRLGLGAPGREGIREPIKGRIKHDTAGLGSGLDKDGDPIKVPVVVKSKVVKLNPKEMKKQEAEAKRRGEKMRNLFFQSDEVLKYLGESA
ncbi:hypothetical protein N7466_002956 [Penicillium verhagenii]|uniref:uncharacterized protein n=1 Tax=Penicillium verhagenii TaxID=1562060 RepID=UPI00254596E3|nr:uncharacterized protein N7466_009898 [Penicillium verhagenii]XP_057025638.1 uncharacterized protein N7466_002956 [Penicillium verhagenii]KAJ5918955.1 hypothetical protein N7466_009898 [Penicillium verhagenii]KAJ5939822.1 hypothetical protein N7466_002956 [Penicillium verhagenii]